MPFIFDDESIFITLKKLIGGLTVLFVVIVVYTKTGERIQFEEHMYFPNGWFNQ